MNHSLILARYLCLGLPLALLVLATAGWRGRPPLPAALLAFLAGLVGIAALHELATAAGWYEFAPVAGAFRGMPVDVWLGWAVLWGPVPVLLWRWLPVPVALITLLWIDLIGMPWLADTPLLRLGTHWWVGELVGLSAVALPAQLLGRWTARRKHLRARAALQFAIFAGLLVWLIPTVAFTLGDGSWQALAGLPLPWLVLLAQAGLLTAVPGLAAVREFVVRGHGTPYPWDPPHRLVTTGPYAHLANPMQFSAVGLLLLLATATGSLTLTVAAALGVAFSAAVAGPHERDQLHRRLGPSWQAYRAEVRDWWPRWRPYRPVPATLWLDLACPTCHAIGRFLLARAPAGLRITPAARHMLPLRRARYEAADGTVADGVAAVGHGLGHLPLGWAYLGWLLCLPGARTLAQVVTDALLAPPHRPGAPAPEGDRCRRFPPTARPSRTPGNGCWTGR